MSGERHQLKGSGFLLWLKAGNRSAIRRLTTPLPSYHQDATASYYSDLGRLIQPLQVDGATRRHTAM